MDKTASSTHALPDAKAVRRWLEQAPNGTTIDASSVREWLDLFGPGAPQPASEDGPAELTWREKLWLAPAETRIGVTELHEAVGRPKSWIYRHTSARTIPHRKLDGELVFVVGEVRAWVRDHEEVIAAGRMESSAADRQPGIKRLNVAAKTA